MRPVFVGNFESDTRQGDLERLFTKYGRVERIDMKLGYAFVYFEDDRDAADAIKWIDNLPFGRDRRCLSVEWARGEKSRDGSKTGNKKPTKTLFIINFDPIETRTRDLERHFEPYGKILSARIRKNFAFVQFETQEEATAALESTHASKLQDSVISVEYALRDDGERDERRPSPRKGSSGRCRYSPHRRSPSPVYRKRSPSPILRSRPSPDYGRGEPSPDYPRGRGPSYVKDKDDRAYSRSYSPEHVRHRR